VGLLWRAYGLGEGDWAAGTELHPSPASCFQRKDNQAPELVGGGDANHQLGVFEAEWSLVSGAVPELLAVSGLDLVELDGAVLHQRAGGEPWTAKKNVTELSRTFRLLLGHELQPVQGPGYSRTG
jgi:hypothetical protein